MSKPAIAMSPPHRFFALHLLLFLSGIAGLGYQLVWTRVLAVGLGHESPSVLATVAGFFAGLTLGAWLLQRPIAASPRPGLWFAALETAIGVWGLALAFLLPSVGELAARWIGVDASPARQWLVAFALPMLALLPATACMGATLPAMERWIAATAPGRRAMGGLYAANTLGAVAGTMLSVLLLMPALGLRGTGMALAAVNLLGAAGAWGIGGMRVAAPSSARAILPPTVWHGQAESARLAREDQQRRKSEKKKKHKTTTHRPGDLAGQTDLENTTQVPPGPRPAGRGLPGPALSDTLIVPLLFFTGLLGIGFEILAVRVLAQRFDGTVFSFAAALAVFLTGTAIGASLYQRFAGAASFRKQASHLLAGLAASVSLGILLIAATGEARAQSLEGAMLRDVGFASLLMLPATLLMGATFSHLAQHAAGAGLGVGRACAINTLGGALAAPLFGVVLTPQPLLGVQRCLVLISAAYLGLALLAALPRRPWPVALAVISTVLMAVACLPDLMAVTEGEASPVAAIPSSSMQPLRDGKIVAITEGAATLALVRENPAGRTLTVNNRFDMGSTSTAALALQQCQGHIPLLLHPAPRTALFLGVATGISLGAATHHRDLHADGVELLPEVVDLLPHFFPQNEGVFNHPRIALHIADARRFVRAGAGGFDVIVGDLFHPAQDGAGLLYTREHFEAVKERLAPGGLFCQWLPLHQLDEPVLKSIIRTFVEVFPHSAACVADYNIDLPVLGLVGFTESPRFDVEAMATRLDSAPPPLRKQLADQLRLGNAWRLLGRLVADGDSLRRFAGDAPVNTDDRPFVIFNAPRFLYQRDATNYDRLMALLAHRPPAAALLPPGDPAAPRLERFMLARDVFFRGLIAAQRRNMPAALDRYVETVRISDDFKLGHAHALTLAVQMSRDNRPAAEALLRRLRDAAGKGP